MRIGIPKEVFPTERRVGGTPRTVKELVQGGFTVLVERGAGEAAEHLDAGYAEVGAELVDDVESLWAESDIILKVRPPMPHPDTGKHEAEMIREGATLISFLWPAENGELLERLARRKVTALAMDRVPRITRAQKVDALSAMANAAGYRAIIEAAHHYPRFLAGQTTAAGSIRPAVVLVIGAGVAGLAAIAAARGLGAIVRAFDTRPEVGEQVRSLGAEFLELKVKEDGSGEGGYAKVMSEAYIEAEMKMFARQAMEVDIIITTALIPGKDAPKLITAGMVESMREGSVIVDLAAQQGGNCVLTVPDQVVTHQGVRIVGYTDLPSRMAIQTSWLYSSTLVNMIDEMGGAGDFRVDLENEIVAGALVTHEGRILWPPPPRPKVETAEVEAPQPWDEGKEAPAAAVSGRKGKKGGKGEKGGRASLIGLGVAALAILAVGWGAPETFLSHLTVFVLACFVGWQVVWNVTPALHTPLISITNAVSGIIILGGMVHLSGGLDAPATLLGAVAVFIAAINISGGFLVTRRMLAMFRK